ncbi:hypothetical protein [Streptomyces sp. NPDC058572]|uniref:hypothetical protein n=1 Tax=Streptomyces sp. NPDC058572 TaxID=3346546 RepID=UPI00365304AC
MPDRNPCDDIKGPARKYCDNDGSGPPDVGPSDPGDSGGILGEASGNVKKLADSLIEKIEGLVAPDKVWAPKDPDNGIYQPFLWLGQHLAVAIFVCVVVVCALTAWQGTPRLKQMGASTGWTLAAVAGMASVPGAVMMLNTAVSAAFKKAFNSDESTLFTTISEDLKEGIDSGNPLGLVIIIAALVVALAFAALVFMTRQLGILVFVCMAPLVLASLARGGDMRAVKKWAMRLLGLMFAPFALLLVSPLVKAFGGDLVMDAVLLVGADVLMLRMIFHGVPYFGPRVAGSARALVERNTSNPLARAVMRAGAPDVYERENIPRGPRTVDTPGRAMSQDRSVLFAAYGGRPADRTPRLTTESAVDKAQREAPRNQRLIEARRQARAAAQPQTPSPRGLSAGPQPGTPGPRASGAPGAGSGPSAGAS